jgi:uncharacterized protein YbaP (TraB family)
MSKIIFFIIALLVIQSIYGQNKPRTLLWEVTQNGSNVKSYLFGTLHEVDTDFFDSLKNTNDKLKTSDVVYVEEINNASDTANILQKLSTWNETKWDKLLSDNQKITFEKFIIKSERSEFKNLPPLILNRVIAGMYLRDFCQFISSNYNLSLDAKIENVAYENKKPVFSLDENQGDILKEVSSAIDSNLNFVYAENIILLMAKMLNDDFSDCQLITNYKTFKIDYELDVDLTKVKNYSPLLIDRNNKWIKILNKPLRDHNCFIAVGLRHLFYKQGLIQQLRDLGFTVRPIIT